MKRFESKFLTGKGAAVFILLVFTTTTAAEYLQGTLSLLDIASCLAGYYICIGLWHAFDDATQQRKLTHDVIYAWPKRYFKKKGSNQ